jgi:hypothetical protein
MSSTAMAGRSSDVTGNKRGREDDLGETAYLERPTVEEGGSSSVDGRWSLSELWRTRGWEIVDGVVDTNVQVDWVVWARGQVRYVLVVRSTRRPLSVC